MKRWITLWIAATLLGLLGACAGTGDGAGSGSSGVTVFGTIDAGVSNYRTQSQDR